MINNIFSLLNNLFGIWYFWIFRYSLRTADHYLMWWSWNLQSNILIYSEKAMAPHSRTLAWKIPWTEEPGRLQSMGSLKVGHDWAASLSLFTATHSSVLAWRIPGMGEPGGLPSMGSHRVGHDWNDLAAAALSATRVVSSAYLNIWKFAVHLLLANCLELFLSDHNPFLFTKLCIPK